MLHSGKGCSDPCRTGANDDEVITLVPLFFVTAEEAREIFNDLTPLSHRVLNQPHAPQLTYNKDPFDIGLKIGGYMGNINPAGLGTKDQIYRPYRTGGCTGPMPYAAGGIDQTPLSVHKADDILLRTCLDAGPAPDALCRIEMGMDMDRFVQAVFLCLLYLPQIFTGLLILMKHVNADR